MARLALAALLALVAVAVAAVLRRRRPSGAPTQTSFEAPTQLDRADFPRPEAPWLVVVFTSATCHTCADMVRKAEVLACREVAVAEAEAVRQRDLHARYHVEAVPITVLADAGGAVRAAFVGPASATDVWAAVAEVRQPGTSPEPHLGQGPASG